MIVNTGWCSWTCACGYIYIYNHSVEVYIHGFISVQKCLICWLKMCLVKREGLVQISWCFESIFYLLWTKFYWRHTLALQFLLVYIETRVFVLIHWIDFDEACSIIKSMVIADCAEEKKKGSPLIGICVLWFTEAKFLRLWEVQANLVLTIKLNGGRCLLTFVSFICMLFWVFFPWPAPLSAVLLCLENVCCDISEKNGVEVLAMFLWKCKHLWRRLYVCRCLFVYLNALKIHSGARMSLKTFALSNTIGPIMQAFVLSLNRYTFLLVERHGAKLSCGVMTNRLAATHCKKKKREAEVLVSVFL